MEVEAVQFLRDHYGRHTTTLFKDFLRLLADLQQEHSIHFEKLKANLPEEYEAIIDQANYFDSEKMQYLRKKVLDMGNDSIRNADSGMNSFRIEFVNKE
jgi:hypothetical protein